MFACPVPEGKSGQQVVDGLQKQVEMMGATKSGNFLVDCETYQSNPQNVTQTRMYMSYIFCVSGVIRVLHCLNMGLFLWTWDNLRRWSIASACILTEILLWGREKGDWGFIVSNFEKILFKLFEIYLILPSMVLLTTTDLLVNVID